MVMRFQLCFMLLWFISCTGQIIGQSDQIDSIRTYFRNIESLVQQKSTSPHLFLDESYWLRVRDKSMGRDKVDALLQLFKATIYKSGEKAEDYNLEAESLAKSISYTQGYLQSRYNAAYLKFVKGNFDTSMQLVNEIEPEVVYNKYPEIYADFATLKSDIHTERGMYDLSLETGLRLLDRGETSGNKYVLMKAYAALSHYYLRTENYRNALDYCLKGLHYILELKETQYLFPKIDEIARMSAKLQSQDMALEAYRFYLGIEKIIGAPGDYIQSIAYMNIADIFMANQGYEKAQEYLSRAIILNRRHNYRFRIPRAYILQGRLHLYQKDTLKAIQAYEQSLEAAEEINAFDVVKSNSRTLASLYKEIKQESKAAEYSRLYRMISDSLFTNEKEQKIVILETKRNIKEISQKKKILELENLAQRSRFNTIVVFLVLLLLISILALYSYFKVRTKNKLLYQRTTELAEVQYNLRRQLQEVQKSPPVPVGKALSSSKRCQELDEDVKDIILSKLKKLENENFFKDPGCNLYSLAEQLKTNPKYLSQVINQEKKSNFNSYINALRINYLLRKLLKDEEFRNSKLSYIAASVGYNNLNTFNSAFKKRQGILPSYFIKSLNQEA